MWRRFGAVVIGLMVLAGLAKAQIKADLDGDGQAEEISLKRHAVIRDEEDVIDCSHLIVYSVRGKKKTVLWEDKAKEFVFEDSREFDYADVLCCSGDVDGDGVREIVAESLPDDLGPVEFSFFVWKGGRLHRTLQGAFIGAIPNGQPITTFKENVELVRVDLSTFSISDDFVYLADIREVEGPGLIRGDVMSHNGYIATALLRYTPKGFVIQKWESAFEVYEEEDER